MLSFNPEIFRVYVQINNNAFFMYWNSKEKTIIPEHSAMKGITNEEVFLNNCIITADIRQIIIILINIVTNQTNS